MQTSPRHKQLTFFALYVAQSIPMSLISTLLPVVMRQQHFSLSTIGMLQLIKLPWILKILWAPLVDRHSESLASYKRWIWGSELCYALCLGLVALLQLELHFPLILALVVLAFACSATQDIATDALTSRSFGTDTVQANRLQAMGQFAGTILGGGVLMIAYSYLGWSLLFGLLALLVLALLIPLQLYREPLAPRPNTDSGGRGRVGWGSIVSFFGRPSIGGHSLMLILFNAGLVGTMAMLKPYLVDAGYALADIAWLFSLYGAGCGFVASFLAGRYLRRLSHAEGLTITSGLVVLAALVVAVLAQTGQTGLWAVMLSLGAIWGAYGAGTVMLYSVAMDAVRSGSEGTDFTLQIVLLHLSSLVVASLSGKLAGALGYVSFFYIEGGLALLSLLYIYYRYHARPHKQIQ